MKRFEPVVSLGQSPRAGPMSDSLQQSSLDIVQAREIMAGSNLSPRREAAGAKEGKDTGSYSDVTRVQQQLCWIRPLALEGTWPHPE